MPSGKRTKDAIRLAVVFTETNKGEKLRNFYEQALGLKVRKAFGSRWVEYSAGSANLAVHEIELGPNEEDRVFLSFEVSNLAAVREKLIKAGTSCGEIRERDRGHYFSCRDPSGTFLHFIEFSKKWRSESKY